MKLTIPETTIEFDEAKSQQITRQYVALDDVSPEALEEATQRAAAQASANLRQAFANPIFLGFGLGLAANLLFPNDPDRAGQWLMVNFKELLPST